jgi:energy-coupling factor transporter ATP-binding protein EcfA2
MVSESTLKTMLTEFSKEALKKSSSVFGTVRDEVKQLFDAGLLKYLDIQEKKVSKIKTLLHRHKPVFLYDIYTHLTLIEKTNNTRIFASSVNKVFWESNFITVLGDAGSGKSTLVKHLFLNTIEEKFGIPIIVELRDLNNIEDNIEEYLQKKILSSKIAINAKILERVLSEGNFVFFLDGFDEINSSKKQEVVRTLISFIEKYPLNRYLITARFFSNVEQVPLFHNYEVNGLSDNEINEFIKKQVPVELSDKIISSINDNEEGTHVNSFIANPLLLSLYILTFQINSSIPTNKSEFYRRVIDALFKEHDSQSKIGYEREFKSGLSQDVIENILKLFCFITFIDGQYDFTHEYVYQKLNYIKKSIKVDFENNDIIDDLKMAIALWVEDGGKISFAHRSLQEYYAAIFLKNLNSKKKEYYSAIEDAYRKGRINEIENFLTLCSELDPYYYIEYLIIPSLVYLKSCISDEKPSKRIRKTFNSFFGAFRYSQNLLDDNTLPEHDSNRLMPVIQEGGMIKSIIMNRYIEDILDIMFNVQATKESIDFISSDNGPDSDSLNTRREYSIDLFDHKNEKLFEILSKDPKIVEAVDAFINQLENDIQKENQKLIENQKSEDDILGIVNNQE